MVYFCSSADSLGLNIAGKVKNNSIIPVLLNAHYPIRTMFLPRDVWRKSSERADQRQAEACSFSISPKPCLPSNQLWKISDLKSPPLARIYRMRSAFKTNRSGEEASLFSFIYLFVRIAERGERKITSTSHSLIAPAVKNEPRSSSMRRHFNPSVYTKASNNLSRQWQRKKNKQIPRVRAAFHALNEKHTFCLLFTLVINSILDFYLLPKQKHVKGN
jgi:hypothetical protein